MRAEQILMMLLLGGVGIGCTLVLYPFFSAILWAAILTYTTWPMYEWCRTTPAPRPRRGVTDDGARGRCCGGAAVGAGGAGGR